jgi:hypothetical protein
MKSKCLIWGIVGLLLILLLVQGVQAETYGFVTKWGGLNHPYLMAMDATGNMYVVDNGHSIIQKFDSAGNSLGYFGEYGNGNGQFNNPLGIAVNKNNGDIYVSDNSNNRIQRFDSAGNYLGKWNVVGPYGIAVDSSGKVYVATYPGGDYPYHKVEKFDSNGVPITSWGEYAFPLEVGKFVGMIYGVAVDSNNFVYVADPARIFRFDKDLWYETEWGTPTGTGDGKLDGPLGVAVDGANNVYVTDYYNHRVQKFKSNGEFLAKWGTYGDGDGQFKEPTGIAVDTSGNVYVADRNQNRIQKFSNTGMEFSSDPSGAQIWIDGADTGFVTGKTIYGLSPGDHVVTFKLAGYENYEFSATVIGGEVVHLSTYDLVPVTPPSITVTAPNGGETWYRGTTRTIRWTYTGDPGPNVKITLLKGGIETAVLSASTSISSGTYAWVIPSGITPGNDYKIAVQSTTQPAVTDTSDGNFAILVVTGSLDVSSDPPGAEIWLDEADTTYVTHHLFTGINPGVYPVKLTLAGYYDFETTVTVLPGMTTTLAPTLIEIMTEPPPGFIDVDSTPQGAEVYYMELGQPSYVDTGQITPYTIGPLFPGQYYVKVTKAHYYDAEQLVIVPPGDTVSADFTLVQGGLTVAGGEKITTTNGETSAVITITGHDTPPEGTITIDVSELHWTVPSETFTNDNVLVTDTAASATWTREVVGDTLTLRSTIGSGSETGVTDVGETVTVTFTGGEINWVSDTGGEKTIVLTATRTDTLGSADFNFVIETPTPEQESISADYTVDTYFGEWPLTVTFIDVSTGDPNPPETVSIDFGDEDWADIGPGGSVSHTYGSPGNYKPVIQACYGDTCDSQTKATITVIYQNLDQGLRDACKLILDDPDILNGNAVDKLMFGKELDAGKKTLELFRGESVELPEEAGYLISIDYFPQANYKHKVVFAYVKKTIPPEPMVILKIIEASSPSTNYANPTLIAGVPSDPAGFTPGPTFVTASSNSLTGGGGGTEISSFGAMDAIPMCSTPDCSHNYALLLSGGVQKEYNYARYRNDIEFLYTTLTEKYGYPKSHITVLMSDGTNPEDDQVAYWTDNDPHYANSITDFDGDTIAEVKDGAVTRTNVHNTLENLRSTLTEEDNLFIFTTNHGDLLTDPSTPDPASKEVILYLWGTGDDGWITDADFVNALPGSPDYPGTGIKSITMVMEQCYGGGFVDNFIGQYQGPEERVIATAANWNELSWGNAYSYQWISGVNGNGYSMQQAHENARDNDYYYNFQPPRENPQFSSYPTPDVGKNQYLVDCPVTPPTPSITVQEPGTTTWYTGQKRDIIWTQAGISGKAVTIELWKGTTRVLPQIATVTLGNELTGTYQWTILSTLASGRDYWINIYEPVTGVSDRSDGSLTINKVRAGTLTTGKLWVNSTPVPKPNEVGALIYIDGVLQKDANGANILTNASFTLSSGTHDVGVERAGYYAVETTPVDVPLSGTKEKNFPLELLPPPNDDGTANDCVPLGTMDIRSTPDQHAKITIYDGSGVEIKWLKDLYTDTKTKIPPGMYTVKVEHDRFLTATQTGVEIVKPDCKDLYRDRRDVIVDFELQPINDVPAIVKIVPRSLNLASKGYFMAFVTLPSGYKAADVDAKSVFCEGATALKLIRHKLFPRTFVAIFRRSDLWEVPTGNSVPMTVEGTIKQTLGNPVFSGSDKIKVISTKAIREDTDDWEKMTDEKVFGQFNPGYSKDDEKVFSQNQRDNKNDKKDNGKSR